jgi:hypothetical protein
MNIKDANLQFNGGFETRLSTDTIVMHHAAASSCTVEDIHRWHLSNGWIGIGYHYFVRKDGSVYRGRPENAVGAHAYGENRHTVGICFEGNFESETMPDAQKQSGIELVADIKSRLGNLAVKGHRDYNATACPGANFPFDEIANGAAGSVEQDKPRRNPVLEWQKAAVADGYRFPKYGADGKWGSECESVARVALVKNRGRGNYRNRNLTALVQTMLGITADGKCYTATETAIRSFQRSVGLTADGVVGIDTWRKLLGV